MSGSTPDDDKESRDPSAGLLTKKAVPSKEVLLRTFVTQKTGSKEKLDEVILNQKVRKIKGANEVVRDLTISAAMSLDDTLWRSLSNAYSVAIAETEEADVEARSLQKIRQLVKDLPKKVTDQLDDAERTYQQLMTTFKSKAPMISDLYKKRELFNAQYQKLKGTEHLDAEQEEVLLKAIDTLEIEELLGEAEKRRKGKTLPTQQNAAQGHMSQEAKFLNALKNTNANKKLSWADIMADEEIDEELRRRIEATRSDLLRVIRSKESLAQENRVIIPGNLKEVMPQFYGNLQISAKLAKCELVEDMTLKVELSRPQIFGNDINARDKVLASLYVGDKPNSELLKIADLVALIESVTEIPDPESIVAPLGKMGTYHIFSLFMRIYCEKHYDTPISKQKRWWKVGNEIRQEMVNRIKEIIGGEAVAVCLITAFDILYRKFVRRVLSAEGETPGKTKLHELAVVLSKKMFAKGSGLFQSLLRVEKRTRRVEKEVPIGKTGRTKKEFGEVQYTARIRPAIQDGPKTPLESSIVSNINNALGKMETRSIDYDLESTTFLTPNEWERKHEIWVEKTYQKTQIPNALIAQRKTIIRSTIFEQRKKTAATPSTGSSTATPDQQRITPLEWKNAEAQIIAEQGEKWEAAFIKAISDMLRMDLDVDSIQDLSEEAILNALGTPDEIQLVYI